MKVQAGAGEGDKFLLVPEDQDTGFSWAGVGDIVGAPSITGSQESPASRSPKSNSKGIVLKQFLHVTMVSNDSSYRKPNPLGSCKCCMCQSECDQHL